jgi:hypothetical protein
MNPIETHGEKKLARRERAEPEQALKVFHDPYAYARNVPVRRCRCE